jgi:predicted outer membrane repeat protein
MAIVGTSGLVFGLGVTGSTRVLANGVDECEGRIVTAAGKTNGEQRLAIELMLDTAGIVCLSGDFILDDPVYFERHATFRGIDQSSIAGDESPVFISENGVDGIPYWDITIENLTIKDSTFAVFAANVIVENSKVLDNDGAIRAYGSVEVANSTFIDNYDWTIDAYGLVEVANSTFINNSNSESEGGAISSGAQSNPAVTVVNSSFSGNTATSGGAISAFGVDIENSTFSNNSALDSVSESVGGAIFCSFAAVINSTFVGNSAVGDGAEGGAIFSGEGTVFFSTFVNNTAPQPGEGDIPGNAIYKSGPEEFIVGASIFAGTSPHPQLGVGEESTPTPIIDSGFNVFSTSLEEDLVPEEETGQTSVFGAGLVSIFGTLSPTLASYAPNTNGTQTIGLAAGSPALDIVPLDEGSTLFDQRGAPRTDPADAGAFEGTISLANTGNENPFWLAAASVTFIALGSFVAVMASRLRRRNS